ncbi:Myosin-1 [Dissostichus eleginoides]|uniref:Myosin-1 n=1 Tax=Dissostichus eleginoides TaxID=100907 RepID=A0AAD9B2T6_DISEL|nr:Myosin-1 [Dissostichus eleginoides]
MGISFLGGPSSRTLIRHLQQTFGSDLLVLSSPGIADIIAFRSCASQTLRLVNDDEDDMESIAVKASKQIIQDVKNIDMDKGHYNISINKDMIKESAIVDHFDADIASQNGKQSTHSLAVLLTQYSQSSEEGKEQTNPKINRIPKDSPDIPYDIDIHRYQGPKQPPMPPDEATKAVCSLKSLAHQVVVVTRASEAALSFLPEVLTQDNCPEYHGYNTKHSREQGTVPQAKTKALYLPLIDMKPSDPDTMMTAMARVQ